MVLTSVLSALSTKVQLNEEGAWCAVPNHSLVGFALAPRCIPDTHVRRVDSEERLHMRGLAPGLGAVWAWVPGWSWAGYVQASGAALFTSVQALPRLSGGSEGNPAGLQCSFSCQKNQNSFQGKTPAWDKWLH